MSSQLDLFKQTDSLEQTPCKLTLQEPDILMLVDNDLADIKTDVMLEISPDTVTNTDPILPGNSERKLGEDSDAIQIRSPTPEDNSGRSLGQLSPSQKAMADRIREMSKQLKLKKSPPDNQ